MNKLLIAAISLICLSGMALAQQNNETNQTAEPQIQPGEIFQNENTRLNAVYAVDQQGDYYGLLFSENQSNYFGTVDGFQQLEGDNVQVCQHYLVSQGGLFGDIFGTDQNMSSAVYCLPLEGNVGEGEMPVGPEDEQNQTNQANETNQTPQNGALFSQQNETGENETEMNETRTPDVFYARDSDGNYVTYLINNEGQVSNVFGSVQSIDQLNQETLTGCEYFLQLEDVLEVESPTQVNCYSYDEIQQRIGQGEMSYLEMNGLENQTQENQTPA